jgi:S-formylglutathione hydrolase
MGSTPLKTNAESRMFDGTMGFYAHDSETCQCEMRFAVYLPPQARERKVPVLYYLSGLTCTEENFVIKAGAQQFAAKHGIALVIPDTSPRNTGIADEDADWTYGSGAGFYVNATQEPWAKHYQMYDYVVEELPKVIQANFNVDTDNASIFGHSMGGHGTLVIALRNPGRFKSVSVFAPICHPTGMDLGRGTFTRYLGDDKQAWEAYDTMCLLKQRDTQVPEILVDQGTVDEFYTQGGLHVDDLKQYAEEHDLPIHVRFREGYDHGYYFIATYIEEHMNHHAKHLLG